MHTDNETSGRVSAGPPAPAPDDRPTFHAVLTPYRSLGPRGFVAVMVLVGGLCFTGGLAFSAMGAWPIVGFLGLDVLIVWLAFRASYRAARAHEEIRLDDETLLIRRVTARGGSNEVRLNPYWARLVVERVEDEGVVAIGVTSHGVRHDIGGFLDPDTRERFAAALAVALQAVRTRGGTA